MEPQETAFQHIAQLSLFPLEVGITVKVAGLQGTFRVVGHEPDGSIRVFGGNRQQTRSFPISRLRAVKSPPDTDSAELRPRLAKTKRLPPVGQSTFSDIDVAMGTMEDDETSSDQ